MTYGDFNNSYNMGIFVDIFPFDKVSTNQKENHKLRKKVDLYNHCLKYYLHYYNDNFIKRLVKFFLARSFTLIHGRFNKVVGKYEKLLTKYKKLTSNYFYDTLSFEPKKIMNFTEDMVNNLEYHKFEFLEIPISKQYDEWLIKEFGKTYMTPIKGLSAHGQTIIDVDNSYTKYQKLNRQDFLNLLKKN